MAQWAPDALLLLSLASCLTALLLLIVARAPTQRTDRVADPASPLILEDFYGIETNAWGPFRWAKPTATLTIPVDSPATYRVALALALQDPPQVQPRRTVTALIDGRAVATFTPDDAVRDYTFTYQLDPRAWAKDGRRALRIELRSTPYLDPADKRALGVILAGAQVAPMQPGQPDPLLIVIPNLLRLVAAYAALRLLGARLRATAALAGGTLAAYTLLAVWQPGHAVFLAYEAAIQPLAIVGMVLLLVGLPALAGLLARVPRRAGAVGLALVLFATLRLTYSLLALGTSFAVPTPADCAWKPTQATAGANYRLVDVWQHADACWFEKIATVGYGPRDFVVAFFPLYSVLVRLTGPLLFGNLVLGGLLVAGAAYVAALVGLYRLVCLDFDDAVARRTILYISVFPAAFFFFAPFTEALFLALAVWAIYAARRHWWGWAALAALAAALTRTQGALLALPLAWEGWQQWRAGRRHPGILLATPAPLLGLAAFTAYTRFTTGLTPFQAQEDKWLSTFHPPWTAIWLSIGHIRWYNDMLQLLNLMVLLLFCGLCLAGWRALPATYSLYAAPQLLILSTRTLNHWFASTTRLVLVIFPIFVFLALLGRRRTIHAAWLVGSTLLLAALLYAFLTGIFVA